MQSAWARGATGEGIKVAVIDTGVDKAQTDLDANVIVNEDIETAPRAADDFDRHGTMVSGFIANEFNNIGTVGVAFKSSILAYRVDEAGSCQSADDCSLLESYITTAIDRAISKGTKIINLSLGSGADKTGAAFEYALLRATNAGIVVVISSGNDGDIQVDWPGRFASDARFKGRLVVVGATNYDNTMASFSNKAGEYKDYYLVAPGATSFDANDKYIPGQTLATDCDEQNSCYLVSGTSFSAPQVSGALALLFQAFPNLTVDQAIKIILDSATDLGTTGIDDVYGHGLLNLDAAFSPIGNTTSSTISGTRVSLNSFNATSSPAFGDALGRANLVTGIRDKYDRSFNLDIGSRINAPLSPIFANSFGNELAPQRIETKNGFISFVPQLAPNMGLNSFVSDTKNQKVSGGGRFALNGFDVEYGFASGGMSLFNQTADNPVGDGQKFGLYALSQAENSLSIGLHKDNWGFGFISSQNTRSKSLHYDDARQVINQFDFNYANENNKINFGIGNYYENGSVLGMQMTGINETPRAATGYFNIGYSHIFGNRFLFNARAQYAKLSNANYGEIFNVYKTPYANAFGLEMTAFDNAGNIVFGIEQPMRAYSGSLQYNLANAYTDWNVDSGNSVRIIGIEPSGREIRYSLVRNQQIFQTGYFSYGIGGINERGNSAYSKPEAHIFIGTGFKF